MSLLHVVALVACWLIVARSLQVPCCSTFSPKAEQQQRRERLIVVGGGASGYFGAIQAAQEGANNLNVFVLEQGRKPLQKVKVSGGGRCNVMHDSSKAVSIIAQGYPRGSKELIGPFKSLFGPPDAAEWFVSRGVRLKTEGDGRMFPVTDDSQTIIDCLEGAARRASVEIITSARVTSITHRRAKPADDFSPANGDFAGETSQQQQQARFELAFTTTAPLPTAIQAALGIVPASPEAPATVAAIEATVGDTRVQALEKNGNGSDGASMRKSSYRVSCDYVLQATGAAREGHIWARSLGHAVSDPVPSLFTLTIKDPRLEGLAGLSVQDAELKLLAGENRADAATARTVQSSASSALDTIGSARDTAAVAEIAAGGRDQAKHKQAATAVAPAVHEEGGGTKRKKKKRAKTFPAVTQRGPLLITHTGVSGPAALKLSAFGARVLNEGGYRGKLVVNWLAGKNPSKALDDLNAFRTRNPKKTVHAFCPVGGGEAGAPTAVAGGRGAQGSSPSSPISSLPRRLWQSLALAAGVAAGQTWAELSKAKLSALAHQLTACDLQIIGKGSFKEEFVTCGGVALSGLDMRTMESRSVPGLFFAGEVIDVDGVTGGFNFQSAWTTGWVAGTAIGAASAAKGLSLEETCADDLNNR